MSTVKRIFWHHVTNPPFPDDKAYAHIHLLVGYNQGTLEDYHKMAEEMKETFPQIEIKEVKCARVTESGSVCGFSIVTWSGLIDKKKKYPGWLIGTSSKIPYSW